MKLSTVIRRPVSEVFAFVTTVENFPRWSGDLIQKSHQTSPGPVGPGTRFVQQNHFLGRTFETQFEVTTYDPDRQFCVQSKTRGFIFVGCYLFAPVGEGTRFTSATEVDVGGFFSVVGAMLVGRIRQLTETNLARLKALLEAAPPGTG